MAKERDNYVYIVEADPQAVARAVRRLQILVLAFIPILLVGVCTAWVVRSLAGDPLSLSSSLPALLILLAIPAVAAYLVVPRSIKKTDVMIGGDFITAPLVATPRYTTTVKYEDITAVKIDVVKDRVAGATIAARGVAVCTGRIKDPGIVVRAIFELAPEDIRWRRSRWPHRRLTREEVQELIEKAQVPSLSELLPPSVTLAQADDVFPARKGFFGRGSNEASAAFNGLSSERPTPASRYVNLMLLQMLEDGSTTRVLKRSEQLPTLALEPQMAEFPPLSDVLNRLKIMCRLDPHADPAVTEGTVDVTINRTPCKLLCRFDRDSDTCCQIRLERVTQ